ncbi:hypothetical protein GcM1_213028 [Golovinomyces cichoracearum]|uniref:Uncharacterized protein n=1 Tax=Golovinomyces cichoracearum TaxID=62708 RepID=A0A420IUI6_9PEZI|nr:hypothetical protein GcM1_213028 [Golovinomyces cichoracearum]
MALQTSPESTVCPPISQPTTCKDVEMLESRPSLTCLREAEVILGRFCDTTETITDPQFRAATEVAVSGLKDQLHAILWGHGSEKTPQTPINTPPTTTNTRPKVPTTHPAAQNSYVSTPNNLKAVPK